MDAPELGGKAISDGTGPLVPNITRAQIESEIPPANADIAVRRKFFNNLPNLLRITDRNDMDNYHYLATSAVPGVTYGQSLGANNRGHSVRYLADTPQSFITAVDQAMAEAGVDGKEVERLDAQAKTVGNHEYDEPLLAYILPAYIQLRMMGYNYTDITF
jgi:hypothetical protein